MRQEGFGDAQKNVPLSNTSASPSHRSDQSAGPFYHKQSCLEFKRKRVEMMLFHFFTNSSLIMLYSVLISNNENLHVGSENPIVWAGGFLSEHIVRTSQWSRLVLWTTFTAKNLGQLTVLFQS